MIKALTVALAGLALMTSTAAGKPVKHHSNRNRCVEVRVDYETGKVTCIHEGGVTFFDWA